jgi:peptide/nickel transport system permease protein
MAKYIIKRTLMIFLIILCVTFILFVLLYSLPGSRIRMLPMDGGGDALDAVFASLNASDNMVTKYVRYSYNALFHLDFGRDGLGLQLFDTLSERTGITLILLTGSIIATLAVGIPAGMYAAVRKDSLGDRAINVLALSFSSIPPYTMAFMVAIFFVMHLRLLPIGHFRITPRVFIMPMLTIMLGGIANIARITRTSMLEVLEQPYITALRAKGLKETRVICRHALKNALVPVLSVLGGYIGQMLCGTFVAEHFFHIRGLGFSILRAVGTRDHYEVLGSAMIATVILAAMNVVVDILYAFVNPKIRLRYASTGIRRKPLKEASV